MKGKNARAQEGIGCSRGGGGGVVCTPRETTSVRFQHLQLFPEDGGEKKDPVAAVGLNKCHGVAAETTGRVCSANANVNMVVSGAA